MTREFKEKDEEIWLEYLEKIKPRKISKNKARVKTIISQQQDSFIKNLKHRPQNNHICLENQNYFFTQKNNHQEKDKTDLPYLKIGDGSFIDKKIKKHIEKNVIKSDLILDLHGMTEDFAYEMLANNVPRLYFMNKRLILLITGKGKPGKPSILKQRIARWINYPSIRKYILYCNFVKNNEGAFHLFLTKIKNQ